ncbi:helix-turn-helix domain-containing protein [Variovorax boronicumulans]
MALGSQIRRYREGLGWTLEKLSTHSGVELGTIGALEKRDSSRSQFGAPIAAAFGLTVEQLLDEKADYLPQLKSGKPASLETVSTLAARWAFRNISPADWWTGLDNDARMLVESYARGILDGARARPKKVANDRAS